jgi:hypothetical protein
LEEIVKDLPEFASVYSMKDVDKQPQSEQEQEAIGPPPRALHSFLDEAYPSHIWGVYQTPTSNGNKPW